MNLDSFSASLSTEEMTEFSLNKSRESMRAHLRFPRKRGLPAGPNLNFDTICLICNNMHSLELHRHGYGGALIRKVWMLVFVEDGCVNQRHQPSPPCVLLASETGQVNK